MSIETTMSSRLEVVGNVDVQSARKKQKPSDLQTASKYPDRIPGYFDCKGTVPANQRAGTDRLAESGYLLNDRRAGQASSGGWAAWNLLLPLIKVAPELAVGLLASGAIYECRQLHWIH